MQTFLDICSQLGVQNLANRSAVVKRSVTENLSDSVVFLACGYEFIMNPSDRKFEGLLELFVSPRGTYAINVAGSMIDTVRTMTKTPHIGVSLEGRGPGGSSGAGVQLARGTDLSRGGVRAGGVANYNLQTKALELIATDKQNGLPRENMVADLIKQMNNSAVNRPWQRSHQFVYEQMADDVRAYWGADTRAVGFN